MLVSGRLSDDRRYSDSCLSSVHGVFADRSSVSDSFHHQVTCCARLDVWFYHTNVCELFWVLTDIAVQFGDTFLVEYRWNDYRWYIRCPSAHYLMLACVQLSRLCLASMKWEFVYVMQISLIELKSIESALVSNIGRLFPNIDKWLVMSLSFGECSLEYVSREYRETITDVDIRCVRWWIIC